MRFPFLRRPRKQFPTAADFGFLELRGGATRLVLIPSLGGKISSLFMGGREWLWSSDVIPLAKCAEGASYLESGDSGGWDECFPTISSCRVPGWVRTYGGIEMPDHGELWSRQPSLDVVTSPAGQAAVCTWTGIRMPYRLQRTVRVAPAGHVEMEYVLHNDGAERLPFIWSSHPMFPLTPETRLILPEGARLRVFASHEIDLGAVRAEHRWPVVRGGGKLHDFSAPFDVAKKYACKLFLDLTEGGATLRQGDMELAVSFAAEQVTHFGLWINKHGWTPFRDDSRYMNLAFSPCIGAPDSLSEALIDWKSAAWVDPGKERRWSMSWTARPVAAPVAPVAADVDA